MSNLDSQLKTFLQVGHIDQQNRCAVQAAGLWKALISWRPRAIM